MPSDADDHRKRTSTVPKSELVAISSKLVALSTDQKNTRSQVLEPLVKDVREVRDVARSTDQAFRLHLKECEKVDKRVKVLEEDINHECIHPTIDEDIVRIDTTVNGHGRIGKRVLAIVSMLIIPIICVLIYSVRSEETMKHSIDNNAKMNKVLKIEFLDHKRQQQEDITTIIRAIDGVPQEVVKISNHDHKELTDDDIEDIVSKLPTLREQRQARSLLRKTRVKQE
jgi:hypothetical protein